MDHINFHKMPMHESQILPKMTDLPFPSLFSCFLTKNKVKYSIKDMTHSLTNNKQFLLKQM
jgi:glutaredoxin-related protein